MMAAFNHVMLSDAVANNRFSAEFFDPQYVFKPGNLVPWVSIGRILKKCEYGISISMNTDGQGYPIFRMNELDNCFALRPEKFAAIPNHIFEQYRLNENDVLFNRTNAFNFVGRTGIVKDQTDCTFASYLIRLIPDCSAVLPEYLTVYLNTQFGIGQIKRRAMRSINQANVSGSEVKRILIPLIDLKIQEEVADLVNTSYQKSKDGEASYTQAQQLLESELGLNGLRFDKPIGYTAHFSELELSRRFDSEHYYPEFVHLKENLPKQVQLVPLGSVLTCCQRGKQPIYSASGLPVLNSKHILENKITLEGNRYAKPTSVTGLQIQYGDVLINGTGRGTIGRTAPYLVSEHQAIPDNHVTILRSSTLDPAYLAFYLNSLAGKLQVEKYQRGSSGQLELYPFDIRKFQVWDAPQAIQQEIRRLYDQATESARQSKQLLDQAKSRVEQLIEEAMQL
jgi:restriction endonuclease S subunit